MDFVNIFRITLRRWYVVVPLLVVTVMLAQFAHSRATVWYEASGSVILMSPSMSEFTRTDEPVIENPYLTFSPSLRTTGSVIGRILLDDTTKAAIAEEGLSPRYEMEMDGNAPVLAYTVTARDGGTALATADRIATLISEQLSVLQTEAQAPVEQQITAEVLTRPLAAVPLAEGAMRAMVAVLAIGGAAAVGAAVLMETVVVTLRERRRSEAEQAPISVNAHEASVFSAVEGRASSPVSTRS